MALPPGRSASAGDLRTTPMLLATLVVAGCVRRAHPAGPGSVLRPTPCDARSPDRGAAAPPSAFPPAAARPGSALTRWAAVGAALLAVGATAALTGAVSAYTLGWALAVASVVLLCVVVVVRGNAPEGPAWGAPVLLAWLSTVLVLALAAGAAVLSTRIVNTSYDDVFYVNRAVFVAERGVVPLRDTIYTNEVLPPIRGAGTVPVSSIETLQGALGHLTGTHGAVIAYLVSGPLVVALSVWVLWGLVRAWSRGPAVLALMVGVAYQVWGLNVAPGGAGNFAVSSLLLRAAWQGKVALIAVALPLAYLVITRWATRRRGWDLVVLFALGAAAVGLSSTAVLLVPRWPSRPSPRWRRPGVRAVGAPLPWPPTPSGPRWHSTGARGPGVGPPAALGSGQLPRPVRHGWVGMAGHAGAAPRAWVGRRGAGAVVATAAAAATVLVVAPFAPTLLADLTGAGPVVWRFGWLARPGPAGRTGGGARSGASLECAGRGAQVPRGTGRARGGARAGAVPRPRGRRRRRSPDVVPGGGP